MLFAQSKLLSLRCVCQLHKSSLKKRIFLAQKFHQRSRPLAVNSQKTRRIILALTDNYVTSCWQLFGMKCYVIVDFFFLP